MIRFFAIFSGILLFVLGLHLWLTDTTPFTENSDTMGHAAVSMVWLTWLLLSVRMHNLGELGKGLAFWGGLILLLVIGYSYRFELGQIKDRVMGEVVPDHAIEQRDGTIRINQTRDGHFHIRAQVNGVDVRFLADTGATSVTLSLATAKKVGVDINALRFTKRYRTANGTISGAPIMLDEVRIGPLVVYNVAASVNPNDMGSALLGMSFFNRLGGYQVHNGILTLYK
ncbi:MAG: TIGR02281 family clan AA aspartic protease [Magnetococcales bacterium]|nr:TIGR02281 family clan AA aspartic protease [Magnetococcales bacterium]